MSYYDAALSSPPVMRLSGREWPLLDLGVEDEAGPLSQLPTRVRERPAGATVRAPSSSSRPTLARVNVDMTRVNVEVPSMERATEPANLTLVSPAPVEPEERTVILARPSSDSFESIAIDRSTPTAIAGFSPTIPAPAPSPTAGPRPSMVSFADARLTPVPVPPSSARATLLPPVSVARRGDQALIAGAMGFVVAFALVVMGARTANDPQIRNLVAHSTSTTSK